MSLFPTNVQINDEYNKWNSYIRDTIRPPRVDSARVEAGNS